MAKKDRNNKLQEAKRAKNDEFYTRMSDITDEMWHYREHFRGKTILCNCDDPRVSKFFHYFSYNFEELGLKKLISTCYKSMERDLFSRYDSETAIWLEYTGERDGGRVPTVEQIGINHFVGDGDFRSAECIELLKEADIVVTNPPFSLFREYVAQLIEYDKKFIILGNKNAITYKEIFPLIAQNKLWTGVRDFSGGMWFYTTEDSENYDKIEDGVKLKNVPSIWFTNLDHKKRHERLELYKRYKPEEYPKYDNYDAINVDKVSEIPMDYEGVMGVPITFLDKYNPEQFEILGIDYDVKTGTLNIALPNWEDKLDRAYLRGKRMYSRIFIRYRPEALAENVEVLKQIDEQLEQFKKMM